MDTEATAKLVDLLSAWFEEHAGNVRAWRTPVGRLMREKLKARGNWKNAPRGNGKPPKRMIVSGQRFVAAPGADDLEQRPGESMSGWVARRAKAQRT